MLKSAVQFVRTVNSARPLPWLVIGQGPSSDLVPRIKPQAFNILTLNRACRLVPQPTLAHFVDLEPWHECAEALPSAVSVCLPWRPHVHCRPSKTDLLAHATTDPHLASRLAAGKLVAYNATSVNGPQCSHLPTVRLKKFSGVGAMNLLASAGVYKVFTLGVDGGTGYGKAFDQKDRLRNGRQSFDDQKVEFDRLNRLYGFAIIPLDLETP